MLDGTKTVRDLAIEAAQGALKSSGLRGEDIDMVIVATSSPEDMFGDAPSVVCPGLTPHTTLLCTHALPPNTIPHRTKHCHQFPPTMTSGAACSSVASRLLRGE